MLKFLTERFLERVEQFFRSHTKARQGVILSGAKGSRSCKAAPKVFGARPGFQSRGYTESRCTGTPSRSLGMTEETSCQHILEFFCQFRCLVSQSAFA